MNRITPSLTLVATLLALGLNGAPAQAQQSRSFVSGLGSDLNAPNCTRTAPCRTFQVAHDNTLANGEITVLDAGSYGAVTISKSISIINDGVGEAGALVSGGGVGIRVTAAATDAVTLRGLTIKGLGPAWGPGIGIWFVSGASLTVENCVIRNLTGDGLRGNGIAFAPTAAGASRLAVSNISITDNQNTGIFVHPTAAGAVAVGVVLDRVGMYNNNIGFMADGASTTGGVVAAITDSIAANNSSIGFFAASAAGQATTEIVMDRSVAAFNGTGVSAYNPPAVIAVGRSTLTSNVTTWQANFGATVLSYDDNQVIGNGDGMPAAPSGIVAHR